MHAYITTISWRRIWSLFGYL